MRISFYTVESNLTRDHGYGICAYNMIKAMQANGHNVPFNDPNAPVQLNFCQPPYFERHMRPTQTSIAVVPWESTKVPEQWMSGLRKSYAVLATSTWVKNIYEANGIERVGIYKHGIEDIWTPKLRRPEGPLTFLHDGCAARKGSLQALQAFKKAFGGSKDVQLILKGMKHNIAGEENVRVINDNYSLTQLVELYHDAHVFIGNSYGEGFGLPGLQGLATGMPSIITKEWAEYGHYVQLGLDSTYIESPWQDTHPGQVVEPDFDQLVDMMRFAYENYDGLATMHYNQARLVHGEFDWNRLTKNMLEELGFDNEER